MDAKYRLKLADLGLTSFRLLRRHPCRLRPAAVGRHSALCQSGRRSLGPQAGEVIAQCLSALTAILMALLLATGHLGFLSLSCVWS